MGIPNSVVDTRNSLFGMRTFTDVLIPYCNRCFVIAGNHEKTKEKGYYAFCKKTNELDHFGPYRNYHEALRSLILSKGCDSCSYNKSNVKEAYLPILDEKIKEEMSALYGKDQTLAIMLNPVQQFMEARNYLNINFEDYFGIKLFQALTDDGVAATHLIETCKNQQDFSFKIQALAGMIDRINVSEIKGKIQNKDKLQGSINMLEKLLKENFSIYPRHIISNLRNVMALRSKMYPAHATTAELLVILRNLGIDKYPLDNWEEGISKILSLCANSLSDLTILLQSRSEGST